MTDEQKEEFNGLADAMIEWLNNSCHPHTTIIVTPMNAELVEGVMTYHTEAHIKD